MTPRKSAGSVLFRSCQVHHELGFWGQTIERYLLEGIPPEAASEDVWTGSEFFRTDRRDLIPLDVFMVPVFEHRVLREDGPTAIEREVTAKMGPLIEDGGYIPTVDHSVPPDISYENFMHYLDVKCAVAEGRSGP
jgi:hypothetical protein